MTTTSTRIEVSEGDLDGFDAQARELYLQGQWIAEAHLERAVGGPRPAGVPYRWTWDVAAQALEAATVALGPIDTARRHLTFVNPALQSRGAMTTHTMSAGFQLVRPGEVAWSHRHSISALRFVTRGNPEAYTAVDGEKLVMDDFDLLLTPRFSWHDHHNPGSTDVVWLDALDLGFVLGLNAVFYEPYGESSQKLRAGTSDAIGTRGHWLRPTWERERTGRLPLRYRWREVRARLELYDPDAGNVYDGLALRYANPVTGGPTMPTMDCWVQRLAPGFDGRPHRRSSSSIAYVIEGVGTLDAGGSTFGFGPGDVLTVPNWTEFRWANASSDEPVLLFSVHDIPVLDAFGLLYEEPESVLGATPAPAIPTASPRQVYRPAAFYDVEER